MIPLDLEEDDLSGLVGLDLEVSDDEGDGGDEGEQETKGAATGRRAGLDPAEGAWDRPEPYELVCVRLVKPVAQRLRELRKSAGMELDEAMVERLILGLPLPLPPPPAPRRRRGRPRAVST